MSPCESLGESLERQSPESLGMIVRLTRLGLLVPLLQVGAVSDVVRRRQRLLRHARSLMRVYPIILLWLSLSLFDGNSHERSVLSRKKFSNAKDLKNFKLSEHNNFTNEVK